MTHTERDIIARRDQLLAEWAKDAIDPADAERERRMQAALEDADRMRGVMGDMWADGMYE